MKKKKQYLDYMIEAEEKYQSEDDPEFRYGFEAGWLARIQFDKEKEDDESNLNSSSARTK